jgi:hypothetical protein
MPRHHAKDVRMAGLPASSCQRGIGGAPGNNKTEALASVAIKFQN